LAQIRVGCVGDVPWQQLSNSIDWMVGDPLEDAAQIRFRIA
jgi:hypothetical protein